MKARIVGSLLLATLGVMGCGDGSRNLSGTSAGTLALSKDEALLYVLDTDNEVVLVVDTATHAVVTEVKVGSAPERILVGDDDTLYVSNRGSRSISVFHRDDWSQVVDVAVGVEPVGLAADRTTLYVVNSTARDTSDYGTLMAIDRATLSTRWEVPVGEEPRGVTLLPGNRALVTLAKQGDVTVVSLSDRQVIRSGTDLYQKANEHTLTSPRSPTPDFGSSFKRTFHPRAMLDAIVSPDEKRVYAPMLWSSEAPLSSDGTTTPAGGRGSYGGGGSCGGGVVVAGVATFEADSVEPRADDPNDCPPADQTADFPPSALHAPFSSTTGRPLPIQGPTAVAVDPTGSWLFVVNRESHNVAVLPTHRRTDDTTGLRGTVDPSRLAPVGSGANGIALTRDGKTAYVYNAFDHTVSVLGAAMNQGVVETARFKVTEDVLPPAVVAGRKMFFDAEDSRMTAAGTDMACSSCHTEAREDGHVWMFPDGPRQTPSLAGRMLMQTAPFHWSGEFPTLQDFMDHTVQLRMGGTGLGSTETETMAAFISSQRAPDNANKREAPTEAQLRGAQIFALADCSRCHAGVTTTNNDFADVGTFVTSGPVVDDRVKLAKGLNVPSLLGLARTAPYLHDGSAATLKDRLMKDKNSNRHGLTANLTDQQIDDLVEYLKSL